MVNESNAREGAWIPVARAAEILGWSARKTQIACTTGELTARRNGPQWEIDATCHPAMRIALGIGGPDLHLVDSSGSEAVLAGLSAAKRETLHVRYGIVRRFEQACSNRPASTGRTEFLRIWCEAWNAAGHEPNVSPRTLERWTAAVRRGGAAALVDARRYSGQAKMSPQAWEAFAGMYLRESRPCASSIYERVAVLAEAEGWDWPSLRTVQQWASRKLDPALKTAGTDPKRFRDRCLPTLERDWSRIGAMQVWVADHRQLDVLWPRYEYVPSKRQWRWAWRRPWLTMFLDCRSWMPVAWTLCFDSPNGNRVMATFARGVLAHGRPEHLYLDNGKDFRMRRFAGGRMVNCSSAERVVPEKQVRPLLERLGVGATFAAPYNARAKVVEPWFRLMSRSFDTTWPSYCGRDAKVRPEALKALTKKAESFLAGRIGSEDLAAILLHDGPADVRDRLCLAPLQRALDAWITNDYAVRESPSRWCSGLSARAAFERLRGDAWQCVKPAEADMALLLMPSVPVRVQPQGVYVKAFGRFYDSPDLDARRCGSGRDVARKVSYRFDPDDETKVYCFDAQSDVFLCVAGPYAGGGCHPLAARLGDDEDRDAVAVAIARQRRLAREVSGRLRGVRELAGNAALELSRRSGQADGLKLDADHASLVAPPPPRRAVIQLQGEISRAAKAGQRHDDERAEQERTWQSAREFFANDKRATGTDDQVASPDGPAVDPWSMFTDGLTGTDAQEQRDEREPNAGAEPL
ncbi:MAG TPA: DNA-binding domain-containing protein [Phycisphaerae bacterium]|nr:DNA-binding domain-containing protein [Phycisphaerae bacterium]